MRQRKRKLEAIKGNTVKALSFTESYGLTADTLTMHTASGNHTRAAVKGCEDYETISKAFVIGRPLLQLPPTRLQLPGAAVVGAVVEPWWWSHGGGAMVVEPW
eukprot:Em0017g499a